MEDYFARPLSEMDESEVTFPVRYAFIKFPCGRGNKTQSHFFFDLSDDSIFHGRICFLDAP
ncbi:MAG: hypothetical protein RL141_1028 [Candidatus Parcubacteria bacterium]